MNYSIKNRLMLIIVMTNLLSLFIAGAAFFAIDYSRFKDTYLSELKTLAEVIGKNSVAALDFNDKETAVEILGLLRAVPHVERAALYTASRELFVQYQRNGDNSSWVPSSLGDAGHVFADNKLIFTAPVISGSRNLGYIYLNSDLASVQSKWYRYLMILVAMAILGLSISILLGARLRRSITEPVIGLSLLAHKVTQEKDYSVRAKKHFDDEIGVLVDSFNDMLEQIARREEERDKAVTELEKHRDHLEEMVNLRTAELEASNKELEAFSYSVSHDLRSPLRVIDGFSQALLEDYGDSLDETGKDYLNRVRSHAQHMAQLIEDLLQLARVTSHEYSVKKVDVSHLAETVVENLRSMEPDREVNIKIQQNMLIFGDERLLEVAMENLIGNAWKYTSKQANPIIEVGATEGNNKQTYFVKDNGVGFDMRYVDNIYLPFKRLHKAEQYPGSGIGLATVKRIIDRHGGHLWAESEPGKGSVFYFDLSAVSP